MDYDFAQVTWNEQLQEDCRQIVRLAVREDLDRYCDWTTVSLVPMDARGKASIVSREQGVISGLLVAQLALEEMQADISLELLKRDGDPVDAQTKFATVQGSARDILTSERVLLNLIGRLSGIASLTNEFVKHTAGTKAKIYDTRKTTPGWRRLEKYAVRTGGGVNHRIGLFAAVLIKDNHLAFSKILGMNPALAVNKTRAFLKQASSADGHLENMIVEVEVDTFEHLCEVLRAGPDIVLLDNMSCTQLSTCVDYRNRHAPGVQLEASGGVSLKTVKQIAETGVDRISVGALTHSAVNFDVGLDWQV